MPPNNSPLPAVSGSRTLPWPALALLALIYTGAYLADPALPGTLSKLGWWGYFDQGRYLLSADALWRGDLRPALHWYPLGYSLLGAPFMGLWPWHPWFFVDLVSFLGACAAFVAVARRFDVASGWAIALFLLPLADRRVLSIWVMPWNTTPEAALIWLLLACVAADIADPVPSGRRRLALGVLMAAIATLRPTDALVSVGCVAGAALHAIARGRVRPRDVALVAAGGALVAMPYAWLHWRIYGPHASEYMVASRRLGFVPGDLPFKAFVLLDDPAPWFGAGQGLLQRLPWLALGAAGALAVPFLLRGPRRWIAGLLAILMIADFVLYLSYIDLLPPQLWRYNNVHYLKWTFPGLALFAWLLLRALWTGEGAPERSWLRRRMVPLSALALVVLALSVRLEPVEATADTPARAAVFDGPPLNWEAGYFGAGLAVADREGHLDNQTGMRIIPVGEELRVVALRRLFAGNVTWAPGHAPANADPNAVAHRYAERLAPGWPCAFPPFTCHLFPQP